MFSVGRQVEHGPQVLDDLETGTLFAADGAFATDVAGITARS